MQSRVSNRLERAAIGFFLATLAVIELSAGPVIAQAFDLVILDTPPLITVSDARVTAQLADYVVFLVRWEKTSRELAINALNRMHDLRKHVGVVQTADNYMRFKWFTVQGR